MTDTKHSSRWAFGPAADIDDLTFAEKANQMGDLRPLQSGTTVRAVPLITARTPKISSPSPTPLLGSDAARAAVGGGEEPLEHTGRPGAGSMPAAVDTARPGQGPVEAAGVLDPSHDDAQVVAHLGAITSSAP